MQILRQDPMDPVLQTSHQIIINSNSFHHKIHNNSITNSQGMIN